MSQRRIASQPTLHLDRSSRIPLAAQLESQVKDLIGSRALRPGERLPTVRRLAETLGVHRNTVQKVYGSLVQQGLLGGQVGRGTFVGPAAPGEPSERQLRLRGRLRTALAEALDEGFTVAEVIGMVQTETAAIVRDRTRQAEGINASRHRFANWGRYGYRGA
jgi:DNA-binding transcriptional regulator YhcF (GntR family)